MHLHCPHCGARDLEEFEFRHLAATATDPVFERIYQRRNDSGQSLEHWQHVHGCRAWLVVDRNPSTGEVRSIRWLGAAP